MKNLTYNLPHFYYSKYLNLIKLSYFVSSSLRVPAMTKQPQFNPCTRRIRSGFEPVAGLVFFLSDTGYSQ